MADMYPNGLFAVILPQSDRHSPEDLRDSLARVFSILKSASAQIIQSAPIVLLDDASPKEAEVLKKRLGVELLVEPAGEFNGSLPKLSWPNRPSIEMEEELPAEQPRDEEKFGEVKYVETNGGVRRIAFEESGDTSDGVSFRQTATGTTTPEPAPLEMDIQPEEEPQTEHRMMFGDKTDANDIFVYNVFLSKISSEGKRERALELISKIRGISPLEAEEIMNRTIVPVIKGITKKESDDIQNMFKESRISVQILKKAK